MDIATPIPEAASAPTNAVELEDLSYNAGGRSILTGITLRIVEGKITGVLGPNGAGKSTLLGLILGLKTPSSGHISFSVSRTPLKRRIGAVLQEVALYDELSSLENLQFAASLYGLKNPAARIDLVLNLIGLSERRNDRVSALSGGMRRRLTIGRALLHEPDILVIDEPTLGVDVEARHAIWNHLRLLRSQGTTVIVSTNYLDEALALCDTAAVLREGKLLTVETPHKLLARAGSCLEIEYAPEDETRISSALMGQPGVLRTERTETGLTVFLNGADHEDLIVRNLLDAAPLKAFRVRAPDLAEVFRAIGSP